MKSKFALVVAAFCALALVMTDADARRMGGGRSLGAQRSVVPQRTQPATPPTAATPTAPAAVAPAAAAPAAATAAARPSGASRWLAPLAGLAAGLGIAALLSH